MKNNTTRPTAPRLSPRVRAIIESNTASVIADLPKPFGSLPAEEPAPAPTKTPRSRRMTAARPPVGRLELSRADNTPAR